MTQLVRVTGRSERTLRRLHAEGVRMLGGGRAPGSGRVGRPAHPPALHGVTHELVWGSTKSCQWPLSKA